MRAGPGAPEPGDPAVAASRTYQVVVAPAAERGLRRLDRQGRRQVLAVIDGLAADPRPSGAARLAYSRPPALRVRTGAYRVVYAVDDDPPTVTVLAAGHRREVYQRR